MRAPKPYRLSFLVGGLLAQEASVAAPYYLTLRDWTATRSKLDAENLLHARTRSSAVRTGRELVQRLNELSDAEVSHLATSPGSDRQHLMWVALCRRYALVAEFAEEVLRDRFVLGEATLGPDDFERFWTGKALWHAELDAVKPSTKTKLRTNLYLAIRQAGLLTTDGLIISPLLSPEVTQFLTAQAPSEVRFFPVGGSA